MRRNVCVFCQQGVGIQKPGKHRKGLDKPGCGFLRCESGHLLYGAWLYEPDGAGTAPERVRYEADRTGIYPCYKLSFQQTFYF